jgi:cryptochrome
MSFQDWNVKRLTFEIDTEPYAKVRDDEISNFAEKNRIQVIRKTSHTLFDPNAIVRVNPT